MNQVRVLFFFFNILLLDIELLWLLFVWKNIDVIMMLFPEMPSAG